ncbi:MAG TPA: LysM peptidoglycan-binding domain-containing protein [Verrucomicrobiae bacterium]|nr:LysM peptidoglycan-binding domain-containing protein [Verrucomicrobiae bacterium]
MGNDISIVRAAAGAAVLAALLVGCSSNKTVAEPTEPPTETTPVAPDASGIESDESGTTATESSDQSTTESGNTTVELRENAPLRYVVKKGDTLWSISNKFLKDSWQWPELWTANEKVKNPHLIYPGDELYLYYVGGEPRLARTGDGTEPGDTRSPGEQGDMVPRVRESSLDQAIYSIPLEAIRAFLRGPRTIDEDLLDDAPYVLAFESDKLLGGSEDVGYALDMVDTSITQYQVVRKGEAYKDPDDNDVIGFEVVPVAEAEVRAFGNPATIYLRKSAIETRAGDYLLPIEEDPLEQRFVPHAPDKVIDGRIISVYNGVSQIGQYQVVTINRGTQQGMEPGHVLSVMQTGRRATDPNSLFGRKVQLPEVKAGTVLIFKTAPRLSYALVMSATRAIHILDKVEKPGTVP